MRVYKSLENLSEFFRPSLTIGTFDGIHLGHQKILNTLKNKASEKQGESVLLTFYPHPRVVVGTEEKLFLLNTPEEKLALLEKMGIDNVVMIPFSREFSLLSPEKYIEEILINKFHPATIVIGYDHKFGKDRKGDFTLLEKLKSVYDYELVEINKEMLDDIAISSTKIRNFLNEGNVKAANELLGYHYSINGKVVKGFQNGRKLGYPTANILPYHTEKLIPLNGIYAAIVTYKDKKYKGLLNIGHNPTFNALHKTIEVNIVDFDKDIYGEELIVELIDYIRPEKKFNSLDELIKAIDNDKVTILERLGSL